DNSTLTLDNADLYVYAQYPLTGDIGGNDSLSIVASRVEIRAKGSAAVDDFNGGISLTDCIFETPATAEVVDATIEDGNGSQVRNLLIVPCKEKRTAWMAFLPLEVNVTEGDELEEPTLLNPEQLSVTYSSSDPSVATVDALTGDVTLVAAGTTTITATFAGNEEYNEVSASYTLTVENGDTTAIEDIVITPSAETRKMLIEGTLYIVRPDGAIFNAQGAKVK
ncbi:MAG: Ig-like domain-containing protein, partial [Paludibacteraceae bacterium]|nr:Ig-like domain-containing protein [Paludibacteraceae bacterium]